MRRVGLTINKHAEAPVALPQEEPTPTYTEDRTRAQLMAELDSRGIGYPKRASKSELLNLLKMGIVLDDQEEEILPDPEE